MNMAETAYVREFHDIYRGFIKDIDDPENLGRCRVWVPAVHGKLEYDVSMLPWARPIVVSPVRTNRYTYNIPDIDDLVWVFFEGGNKSYPVFFGGSYAKDENILDKDNLIYDRKTQEYIVNIKNKQIKISDESIDIIGDTNIEGSLSVSGDTNIGGSLHVSGSTSIGSTLSVSGSTTISGTLTVSKVVCTGSCNKECRCYDSDD